MDNLCRRRRQFGGRRATPLLLLAALWLAGCNGSGPAGSASSRPESAPETLVTPTGIEMVLVPAGRFVMGSEDGPQDEAPPRTVELGAFLMDTNEVTQESYRRLMGRNPSKFEGPDRPVERLSYFGAVQYCNMRSLREKLAPCYDLDTLACDFGADGYRLPTEAEWEYACRAGTTTPLSFGNDSRKLGDHAWFQDNAGKATHPVRQKRPNPWGLYDVHGNVAEWCHDFYDAGYYQRGETRDPRGPESGDERVLRGGHWAGSAATCRSSARASEQPGFSDVCFGYERYGFRCVRKAPGG